MRPGAISANFSGVPDLNGTAGTVPLTTGGAFVGPGAQGAHGAALGPWRGPAGPPEYSVSGPWFVERK